MKKTPMIVFTVLCLAICMTLSVGMLFHPTTQPIGNEKRAVAPTLFSEDGTFNTNFASDLGTYFEKSFAFRPEIITADAWIKSKIFGVSNVDSVIVGTDDWLYYSSTLDDYLGRNALTDQQAAGIVHNLMMIQNRVEQSGAKFLFTVAPNKNTLYPEHMPYQYAIKASENFNRDTLGKALEQSEVNYCDLFTTFEGQDEVLYFARDSHWNNKGALLASDTILDKLEKAHDDYAAVTVERRKDFVGDLDKMVFPATPRPEYNHYYGTEDCYEYVTNTTSVEDSLIRTHNPDATGSLYMYRDSFGNLLLPVFASAYANATFTKSFPMMLGYDLDANHPDTVIFEIAERNVDWFITEPPIMEAPVLDAADVDVSGAEQLDVTIEPCEYSPLYLTVSGTLDYSQLGSDPTICVLVVDEDGKSTLYECYNYLTSAGDNGFLAYLDASKYDGQTQLKVSVISREAEGYRTLGTDISTIEENHER